MPENLNSEWKDTGKNLGAAFKGLGKSLKSEVDGNPQSNPSKEDWKDTGKDLGNAFKGLGKTLIKTAKKGVDKTEQWATSDEKAESAEIADNTQE